MPELNLNYPSATTPQHDLMISSIQAIHAAGDSVGYVSLLLGSNDIFYLVGNPAFQGASLADQQAMLGAVIGNTMASYQSILFELVTLAPEATIFLPGYYNPFPSFAPERALYDSILAVFNPAVKAYAEAFGAKYVDLYPLIDGRELELTNIATGDVHPTQAGYGVIANGFRQQAVPEPASMLSIGVGIVGILGYRRRCLASKR